MKTRLLTFLFSFVLISCSEVQEPAKAIGKIRWFDGSIEAAFEHAQATQKPVFLYWGAVWCPPCQEIRNTVFKSPRFIELSDEFVAVYLDGDTEAAQQAGQKFATKGYPTMIVLNPAGDELTRIPGGIDISRYNDVLADSLNMIQPTRQLVTRLVEGEVLTDAELKQLAFYSWGQDSGALPEGFDPTWFKTASQQASNPIVSSRLYMQFLIQHQQSLGDKESLNVVEGAYERISKILSDSELVLANWSEFIYYAKDLIPLIAESGQADDLKTSWQSTVLSLRETRSLSTADQLGAFFPVLDIAELSTDEIPDGLVEELKLAVKKADKITTNASARQSVINQAGYLLNAFGLVEDAKALLLAEIEKSEAPYYFMTSLGSIAEKQEDHETSLGWHKRAYDESVGNATRLQWGATYVRALIRMAPEDAATIVAVTKRVIQEVSTDEELLSGRNFRVTRSMAKALHKWQSENVDLTTIFSQLEDRCTKIRDNETLKGNCAEITNPWQTQPLVEAGHG